MDRRTFIQSFACAAAAGAIVRTSELDAVGLEQQLAHTEGRVVLTDPDRHPAADLKLSLNRLGNRCRPSLINAGKDSIRVKEVVLFDLQHRQPADTGLYGESFQMLSQTAGTVAHPVDLGYNEVSHYKIPGPRDATVITGLLMLSPAQGDSLVLAYTSCHRFIGRFYIKDGLVQAVVDTENLTIVPGETWHLEELLLITGPDHNALLEQVADRININHPPLLWKDPPRGWCSYYCYGNDFTAQQVLINAKYIAEHIPELTYVQVDDGYQPWMGDWLDTVPAFGQDIGMLLKQIRDLGQEPALWIGPFIADPQSKVFLQHPDWFIQNDQKQPLQALNVTFGGWGRKGWYALDGTHPEVQQHLENIFRYMRQEWDCRYFKLDANFWGAMHGGKFHDPNATRIQAYRRGMEAIRRGAGEETFLLGCNHPIWPSFGLIHGSRSSDDIARNWSTVSRDAVQTMHRNWQNGRLWWNDPDAVCLTGDLSENEFLFHATAAYASGGMILSGDDLTKMPPGKLAILRRLIVAKGQAAAFTDSEMNVGLIQLPGAMMVCLFNPGDQEREIEVHLSRRYHITDYWSDEDLGEHDGSYRVRTAPRAARLLRCS